MDFNEYQKKCFETNYYPKASNKIYMTMESINKDFDDPLESIDRLALAMYALGLTGEAGEVADKIKKVFRDKAGVFSKEDAFEIAKELSDNFWYISVIAGTLGYTLERIAEINIEKLKIRVANNKIHGSGDNR